MDTDALHDRDSSHATAGNSRPVVVLAALQVLAKRKADAEARASADCEPEPDGVRQPD